MDKKQLYESIMMNVAREVKKALVENAPYMQDGSLKILCDDSDRKVLAPIIERAEQYAWDNADEETFIVDVDEEDPITLAGVTGYVSGQITFDVNMRTIRNSDAPGHYWYETEIMRVKLYDYDLTLYDDESEETYTIYMQASDLPRPMKDTNIEDTEIRRNYLKHQQIEKEKEMQLRRQEHERKQKEYEAKVKADPDKYIKLANEYLDKAAENYHDWDKASDAEKIFKILGMKKDQEIAHNTAVSGYHREEASSGLL